MLMDVGLRLPACRLCCDLAGSARSDETLPCSTSGRIQRDGTAGSWPTSAKCLPCEATAPADQQQSASHDSASRRDVAAAAAADVVISADYEIPGQQAKPRMAHLWRSPHDSRAAGACHPEPGRRAHGQRHVVGRRGCVPLVPLQRSSLLFSVSDVLPQPLVSSVIVPIVARGTEAGHLVSCSTMISACVTWRCAAMIGAQGTEALGAAGMTNLVINLSVSLLMGLMLLPTTSVAAAHAKNDPAKVRIPAAELRCSPRCEIHRSVLGLSLGANPNQLAVFDWVICPKGRSLLRVLTMHRCLAAGVTVDSTVFADRPYAQAWRLAAGLISWG